MSNLEALLKRLLDQRVEFVIDGGYAVIGNFDAVLRESVTLHLGFCECRVLSLDALIRAKEATGRPRDRQAVLELRAIKERPK